MIINLRKLDYILIVIIIVLYLITAVIESLVGQTFMRFLSPVLILIFVIVYLQTIRSLEQELKRIRNLSNKEILESVNVVDTKLGTSLTHTKEEYKEIKYLQHIVKLVEENVINEIRNRTEIQHSLEQVEESLLTNLINKREFQEIMGKVEEKITKDIGNKTEQLYFQLDGLMSIYKVLQDVKYPVSSFRGWAVSPDVTRILMKYVFDIQPEIVMELGSGVSTIITGYCLKMNGKGKLISLEHNEVYYNETLNHLKAHNLEDFVDLIHAPLKKYELNGVAYSWYDLAKADLNKPIDLLTVDGPPGALQKESRLPAFPLLKPFLNTGAVLIIDDYGREDEKNMVREWLKDTNLEQLTVENTEKGTCILRFKGN